MQNLAVIGDGAERNEQDFKEKLVGKVLGRPLDSEIQELAKSFSPRTHVSSVLKENVLVSS